MIPVNRKNSFVVFIEDLPQDCIETDIIKLVQPHGRVNAVTIHRHHSGGHQTRTTGVSATAEFQLREHAENVLNYLENNLVWGKKLKVQLLNPSGSPAASQLNNLAPKPMRSAQVHISYLSKQLNAMVSEQMIYELFSNFGKVLEVSLKKKCVDTEMCIQNGYGFVHYPLTSEGIEAALQAVESLHQVTINNVSYDCSVSNQLRQVLFNTGRLLKKNQNSNSHPNLLSAGQSVPAYPSPNGVPSPPSYAPHQPQFQPPSSHPNAPSRPASWTEGYPQPPQAPQLTPAQFYHNVATLNRSNSPHHPVKGGLNPSAVQSPPSTGNNLLRSSFGSFHQQNMGAMRASSSPSHIPSGSPTTIPLSLHNSPNLSPGSMNSVNFHRSAPNGYGYTMESGISNPSSGFSSAASSGYFANERDYGSSNSLASNSSARSRNVIPSGQHSFTQSPQHIHHRLVHSNSDLSMSDDVVRSMSTMSMNGSVDPWGDAKAVLGSSSHSLASLMPSARDGSFYLDSHSHPSSQPSSMTSSLHSSFSGSGSSSFGQGSSHNYRNAAIAALQALGSSSGGSDPTNRNTAEGIAPAAEIPTLSLEHPVSPITGTQSPSTFQHAHAGQHDKRLLNDDLYVKDHDMLNFFPRSQFHSVVSSDGNASLDDIISDANSRNAEIPLAPVTEEAGAGSVSISHVSPM